MEKTAFYFKKIIAFLIISSLTVYSVQFVHFLIAIPLGLLFFAFVYHQFTTEKPPYLFELNNTNAFMQNKNGFWGFLKPLIMVVGFIYDIVVWLIWSVFLIFILFTDVIFLIKAILFWIAWGILWFLKLFVPPLVILYRFFIYYLLKWPWWLYRLCYLNVKNAFNRNFYYVSVWGAVIGAFLFFLFYFIEVLTGTRGISSIGIVLAIIPISWSIGEICSIKKNNIEKKPYWEIKRNFKNGFEAVRVILNYILLFLVLFLIQVLLNLTGWMPKAGITFLGIFITINTAISFVLIVTFFILSFSALVIPNFTLYSVNNSFNLENTLSHLSAIVYRFLRNIFVHIPAQIFNVFVLVIPIALLILSAFLTIQIKNAVIDFRIKALNNTHAQLETQLADYKMSKKIESLEKFKNFTMTTQYNVMNMAEIKNNIKNKRNQIGSLNNQLNEIQEKKNSELNMLSKEKKNAGLIPDPIERENQIDRILENEEEFKEYFAKKESSVTTQIEKLNIDIEFLESHKKQLPIVFFFICIWGTVFGGLVLAFSLAFYGNIAYDLYNLKVDGTPSYWTQEVRAANAKNRNQPLLGFTLLVILVLGFLFFKEWSALL